MSWLLLITVVLLFPVLDVEQDTIEVEIPFTARSLKGVVVDHNGARIPAVLIERLSPDRKNVQEKTLTDTRGSFRFRTKGRGNHLLRLTKDVWSPLYVAATVDVKSRVDLKLTMTVAR